MNLVCDSENIIAIVIALDILHKNFDITATSHIKTGNKTINQIHKILQPKGAKMLIKQTITANDDFTIVLKENYPLKKIAKNIKEYYYCQKLKNSDEINFLPTKDLKDILSIPLKIKEIEGMT